TPSRFVFKESMKEIQHGILLAGRVVVGSWKVHAVLHLASEQLAWEGLVLDALSEQFRAEEEQNKKRAHHFLFLSYSSGETSRGSSAARVPSKWRIRRLSAAISVRSTMDAAPTPMVMAMVSLS